jgi:hypothetical protein
MKFQDILNDLVYGELTNINIGANEDGTFDDKHYNRLISHLNLGLTDLHKQFSLKTNTIELILQAGRYRYHLDEHHKFSDEALVVGDFQIDINDATLLVENKKRSDAEYIRDRQYNEFKNDILLITAVMNRDEKEYPLNVIGNPWSVRTPRENVLEFPRRIVDQGFDVPEVYRGDRVWVKYRQNHERIHFGAGEFDGNRVEIELPETHRQALLFFIASRIMNPVGMGQEFNAGNTYYTKYMNECQVLTEKGMYIEESDESTRFESKGFA